MSLRRVKHYSREFRLCAFNFCPLGVCVINYMAFLEMLYFCIMLKIFSVTYCFYSLENCFIDEGYSGLLTPHIVTSPFNIGAHSIIQPSQVCARLRKFGEIATTK